MQTDLFDDNSLFNDLWDSYFEARKHKRNTLNELAFEQNLEHNIFLLYKELTSRCYKLSPSICFIVNEPVKREIFAAHFRDRIIHHYIIQKLMPIFENQFIYDCYSCREGKGTLFGIKRLEHFMRSATENYTKEAYIMKLDLSGFFMSINKHILWKMIGGLIDRKYNGDDKDLLRYLSEIVIMNNPTEDCIIKGKSGDWDGLPANKSLFRAKSGCGLPIGNLTSQVFANYYLTPFDRFVKETLKMRCYGRYVDDFFIIHQDKQLLQSLKPVICQYLRETVQVALHPKKMYLQSCSRGVAYLGCHIKPWGKYLTFRVQKNIAALVKRLNMTDFESLHYDEVDLEHSRVNSYLGQRVHYDIYRYCHGMALHLPDAIFSV